MELWADWTNGGNSFTIVVLKITGPWTESSSSVSTGAQVSSTNVGGGQRNLWDRFNVTSAIQDFIRTPSSNYGVLLQDNGNDGHRWFSSENGDVARRPKLIINYTATTDVSPMKPGMIARISDAAGVGPCIVFDIRGRTVTRVLSPAWGGSGLDRLDNGIYIATRERGAAAPERLLLIR